MTTCDEVVEEIAVDGGPDDVWAAVVAGEWLGDDVELDVRVGGTGHVTDDGATRQVLVTAVEPGRRIAWHWWSDDGDLSSVEVTVVPDGAATIVRVVERTMVQPVARFHWQACAGRLAGRLVRA
jgi:Activator of Hsp90 ATPase homolog 1-like protein